VHTHAHHAFAACALHIEEDTVKRGGKGDIYIYIYIYIYSHLWDSRDTDFMYAGNRTDRGN